MKKCFKDVSVTKLEEAKNEIYSSEGSNIQYALNGFIGAVEGATTGRIVGTPFVALGAGLTGLTWSTTAIITSFYNALYPDPLKDVTNSHDISIDETYKPTFLWLTLGMGFSMASITLILGSTPGDHSNIFVPSLYVVAASAISGALYETIKLNEAINWEINAYNLAEHYLIQHPQETSFCVDIT